MFKSHVIINSFESGILKNNPLNDPTIRDVVIYLPPGYDESKIDYPVVFLLSGFMGKGIQFLNREAFGEAIDERLDRLIATKQIAPMIVVMPDCFTYYGGSQYLDSSATGLYETYLTQELIPYIRSNFRTSTNSKQWAIMGKSSGGYGALVLGMHHPDIFGIVACHSGDMGFEYCYLPDFPDVMMTLEKHGGITPFMKNFYAKVKKDSGSIQALNIIAMAAAYSSNTASPEGFNLPFDIATGEIKPAIWQQWLNHDPIHMIDAHIPALRQLHIFLDCGTRDECRLFAGARRFAAKLQQLNIEHIYKEFDDTHRSTSYRYDCSLQFISHLT